MPGRGENPAPVSWRWTGRAFNGAVSVLRAKHAGRPIVGGRVHIGVDAIFAQDKPNDGRMRHRSGARTDI
jgi:hypothetical protein